MTDWSVIVNDTSRSQPSHHCYRKSKLEIDDPTTVWRPAPTRAVRNCTAPWRRATGQGERKGMDIASPGRRGLRETPMNSIPVIDIAPLVNGSPDRAQAVAMTLGSACREVGFFYVSGHGIPPELIARVFEMSAAFFAAPAAGPRGGIVQRPRRQPRLYPARRRDARSGQAGRRQGGLQHRPRTSARRSRTARPRAVSRRQSVA